MVNPASQAASLDIWHNTNPAREANFSPVTVWLFRRNQANLRANKNQQIRFYVPPHVQSISFVNSTQCSRYPAIVCIGEIFMVFPHLKTWCGLRRRSTHTHLTNIRSGSCHGTEMSTPCFLTAFPCPPSLWQKASGFLVPACGCRHISLRCQS